MDLYKYCGRGAIQILKNKTIWFTQAKYLNDPFELNPSCTFREPDRSAILEMVRDQYFEVFEDCKMPYKKYKDLVSEDALAKAAPAKESRQKALMEDLNKDYTLLCLTTSPDNLTMWAHYADRHMGCVLRFNGDHPFFNAARKVKYSDRRPWVGLAQGSQNEAQEILYTKSSHWANESEVRLIGLVKDGRAVKAPAGHPTFETDIPAESITGIILGCKASQDFRDQLAKALAAPELRHLEIMHADIHRDNFQLEITSLQKKKTDVA